MQNMSRSDAVRKPEISQNRCILYCKNKPGMAFPPGLALVLQLQCLLKTLHYILFKKNKCSIVDS